MAEPPANGIDLDLDVDGAGAVDAAEASSAVAAVEARIDTAGGSTTASRARANARPPAPSANGSDETAETPPFWCFRARSGFTWEEARPEAGPQHTLSRDTNVVWQGSESARIGATGDSLPGNVVGVMWQGLLATPLRGKRVEVSAQIRPRIAGIGHLFVRTQPEVPMVLWLSDQDTPGARPQSIRAQDRRLGAVQRRS